MLLIARSAVEKHLPMAQCIELMRTTMEAVSAGAATQPLRQFMPVPGAPGKLAIMPGTLDRPPCFGIKLVCKYERPAGDPLGTHVGMVVLFDSALGVPLALVEGSSLTEIRTAAASGLATDLLARPDCRRLALIGTGAQAARHVSAMRAVRAIDRISVWGRDIGRTEAFAGRLRREHGISVEVAGSSAEAVAGADIICTTTSSTRPLLAGRDLEPGQHLNLVGAAIPTSAEIDTAAVVRGSLYVDSLPAALNAAGELRGAIEAGAVGEDHVIGEIGAVIAGDAPGRRADDEITIYKSLGLAAQDLAAAHHVWQAIEAAGECEPFDLLG